MGAFYSKFLQLRRGEIDAAALQLAISHSWRSGTDVSASTKNRHFRGLTSRPGRVISYETLALPLTRPVWAFYLASVLLVYAAFHVEIATLANGDKNKSGGGDIFLLTVGILVSETVPKWLTSLRGSSASKQLLLVSWLPLACLLSWVYQSTLLSFLVKVAKERPIDTYQDVLDRQVPIYVTRGNMMGPLMATHPLPVVREAYDKLTVLHNRPYEEVMSLLVEGKAVIITGEDRFAAGHRHHFRLGTGLQLASVPAGYLVAVGHPLNGKVTSLVLGLVESGIHGKVTSDYYWLASLPEREHHRSRSGSEDAWRPLGTYHLLALFVVEASVVLAGCLVLFCELVHARRCCRGP